MPGDLDEDTLSACVSRKPASPITIYPGRPFGTHSDAGLAHGCQRPICAPFTTVTMPQELVGDPPMLNCALTAAVFNRAAVNISALTRGQVHQARLATRRTRRFFVQRMEIHSPF